MPEENKVHNVDVDEKAKLADKDTHDPKADAKAKDEMLAKVKALEAESKPAPKNPRPAETFDEYVAQCEAAGHHLPRNQYEIPFLQTKKSA